MNTPIPTPEFLTAREVEKLLRITYPTLRRLIDGGDLPAYKFGRDLRFARADVDGYINGARRSA